MDTKSPQENSQQASGNFGFLPDPARRLNLVKRNAAIDTNHCARNRFFSAVGAKAVSLALRYAAGSTYNSFVWYVRSAIFAIHKYEPLFM